MKSGIFDSGFLRGRIKWDKLSRLGPDKGRSFGYFGSIIDDVTNTDEPGGWGAANWGGVYGHSWLVDHANELTILSLTNTALEGCTGANPKDLIRAVYADLI